MIKQVLDPITFIDFLNLVQENTYYPDEFDCGWSGYIDFIICNMYKNTIKWGLYVMYTAQKPVGYMILQGPDALMNNVCMYDMYITQTEQSKKLIVLFVDRAFDICQAVGAKKLVFRSPSLKQAYWVNLAEHIGVNLKEVTEYQIRLDDTFSNTRIKDVVREINENIQQS